MWSVSAAVGNQTDLLRELKVFIDLLTHLEASITKTLIETPQVNTHTHTHSGIHECDVCVHFTWKLKRAIPSNLTPQRTQFTQNHIYTTHTILNTWTHIIIIHWLYYCLQLPPPPPPPPPQRPISKYLRRLQVCGNQQQDRLIAMIPDTVLLENYVSFRLTLRK